jgi:hypothetical protein
VSIEILPKEEAEKLKNAGGRDAPNAFPSLPEPSGRFSFVKSRIYIIYRIYSVL